MLHTAIDEIFTDIHGNIIEIPQDLQFGRGEDAQEPENNGITEEGLLTVEKLSGGEHICSPLVSYILISPNCNRPRNHKIDRITIHCMAGNLSVETCGRIFLPTSRQASSTYGIGTDGRIACYCYEENRPWTSSSPENDHRAITIEVANDGGEPDWHVSDKAMESLINLCADICRRNDISELIWSDNREDRVNQRNGCNMTVHRDFAATACPGAYLLSKQSYIAAEVNKMLHPPTALKGVCQMPNPNGEGFLLGLEAREDDGYTGEISIYDCSQQAWIAGTGRCYMDNNALWWIWNPSYGYYWTLFRLFKNDEILAEECYGFQNI